MPTGKSLEPKLGSSFVRNIPAPYYNPPKKAPSRRDKHRAGLQHKTPAKSS